MENRKKSYEKPVIQVIELDIQPMLQTGTGTPPQTLEDNPIQ